MGSGESQHLSDRHSVIVTKKTDNKQLKFSLLSNSIFMFTHHVYDGTITHKQNMYELHLKSKCPVYVTSALIFSDLTENYFSVS